MDYFNWLILDEIDGGYPLDDCSTHYTTSHMSICVCVGTGLSSGGNESWVIPFYAPIMNLTVVHGKENVTLLPIGIQQPEIF